MDNINDLLMSLGDDAGVDDTVDNTNGVDTTNTGTNNTVDNPQTTDPTQQQTQTDPPPTNTDEGTLDNEDLSKVNKASSAFAQMRVENKHLQETIKGIAASLGLNTKGVDTNTIVKDMQNALIKAQAQQNKIPEELLQRLHTLEQAEQASKKDKLEQDTLLGLQALKNQYGATSAELKQFVSTLIEEDLSPFEQPVDIVSEYKLRNFDKIVEQAVQKALLEERQRVAKADSHSSQPGTEKGATKGEPVKVNTISALEEFFSN